MTKTKTTSNALITFIKNPELGKAKTRIAKTVGDNQAMEVYLELLDLTRGVVEAVDINRYLYYSHFINEDDDWANTLYTKGLQIDGDLGDKMHDAFVHAFEHNSKVIIVGSDCPYITSEIIQQALEALEETDVVIGPAEDGGYYLIGMKKVIDDVFFNMEWSVEGVRTITEQRLASAGLTYFHLPTLSDIDYWEDWQRYLKYAEDKRKSV